MHILKGVYAYVGDLPLGCVHCMHGSKMVVFITGLCGDNCFYCPVSPKRLYRDVMYVDEEPLRGIDDLLEEAYRIGADGASITGGDPLAVPGRTFAVIDTLKEYMGSDFHVHLYTSGRYLTEKLVEELERVGLDELRLHPTQPWLREAVAKALRRRRYMKVGVEVPVIPGREEELKSLILWLDRIGADFINLNELEVSERNLAQLLSRGLRPARGRAVVEGSEETALRIIRWAEENGINISIHYCPAGYKDSVQMRLRLVRKAMRLAKPYERVTLDGMLEYFEAPVEGLDAEALGGERVSGSLRLHPLLARKLGLRGVVKRRYPSVLAAHTLPSEAEGKS